MRLSVSLAAVLVFGCMPVVPALAQSTGPGETIRAEVTPSAEPRTVAPASTANVQPAAAASADAAATPPVVVGPTTPPLVEPLGPEIAQRIGDIAGRTGPREDRDALVAYYTANPDKPLWIADDRLSPRAARVIAELGKADDWGLNASDYAVPATPDRPTRAQLVDAEARLSLAALKYARHARGGRVDPRELSNYLDRQPPIRSPKLVIEELAAAAEPDAYLRKLNPQHPQFEHLRRLYLSLKSAPPPAPAPAPAVEPEPAPGKGGKSAKKAPTTKAAQAPEQGGARKVLLNMEAWRWMPDSLGQTYIWVNIPEFLVRVVKNGQVIHTERIISGKTDTQTPIFSDEMETVVFHPGWGVPNSIKVKELLPGLVRGGDVLARNGLVASYRGRPVDPRSIDWAQTDIRQVDIIQPPGPTNVLGVVKFLFPNKHDVYMHDTPTKNLFNADVRTFSHGCMRVRNPVRLAEIIMEHDQGWTPQRVAQVLASGAKDNNVRLKTKIPVHVTYFTASVDDAGKPHYFRDVYGHEPKIQMGLDGKAHLIAKSREDLGRTRAEVVGRLVETRSSFYSSGNQWMRNIFGF